MIVQAAVRMELRRLNALSKTCETNSQSNGIGGSTGSDNVSGQGNDPERGTLNAIRLGTVTYRRKRRVYV